jgi:hypothetical protein
MFRSKLNSLIIFSITAFASSLLASSAIETDIPMNLVVQINQRQTNSDINVYGGEFTNLLSEESISLATKRLTYVLSYKESPDLPRNFSISNLAGLIAEGKSISSLRVQCPSTQSIARFQFSSEMHFAFNNRGDGSSCVLNFVARIK